MGSACCKGSGGVGSGTDGERQPLTREGGGSHSNGSISSPVPVLETLEERQTRQRRRREKADLERKQRYLREKEARQRATASYKKNKSGDDGFVDIFM